ncbi:MAG TPA: hypothetical protein VD793_04510 [Gemmatimonadales bacterium]|nr:hypothetical protein [Gemmatimonadales bacterium]
MSPGLRHAALVVGVAAWWNVPLRAQDWLFVEGLIDVEGWITHAESRLLARNQGDPGPVGRLTLWTGVALHPRVQLLAQGYVEAGSARAGDEGADPEPYVDQLEIRYLYSRHLVLEVGKILQPVGAFGPRRYSTSNPLIGAPDSYPTQYPWGLQASGVAGAWDYRIGMVSLPLFRPGYTPQPGHRARAAGGAGITPVTGFRIGLSGTYGPYLSADLASQLPPGGGAWHSYQQAVIAGDLRFSRGYLEVRAEVARSWYDAPTAGVLNGDAEYVELKYTWTPRFFTATRWERNNYPFIRPVAPTFWIANVVALYDGEVGAGYRVGRNGLVKLSFRKDYWDVDAADRGRFPNGYAAAVQVAHRFNPLSWIGWSR